MKDEKRPDKLPHFIIHNSSFILFLRARLELAGHDEEPVFIALEAIPRRGLGEAGHLAGEAVGHLAFLIHPPAEAVLRTARFIHDQALIANRMPNGPW